MTMDPPQDIQRNRRSAFIYDTMKKSWSLSLLRVVVWHDALVLEILFREYVMPQKR